ncbi:MAG: PhoH family protein, partial [Actinobacteria bacterium]|nr:PhoH family protein [Actinomycetota bacterium]
MLDTSVLLSDPKALFRFEEHEVVIPIVVINELEKKRNDLEIGYFARKVLRNLDELRQRHERLDFPVEVGQGGTLRVELNHIDQSILPTGFQLGDNDSRILAVAANLSNEGFAVTVVSKDLPMRVKASSIGLRAEEYLHELATDEWSGISDLHLSATEMANLYDSEEISHPDAKEMPINTGLIIHSERGSALGRVTESKT